MNIVNAQPAESAPFSRGDFDFCGAKIFLSCETVAPGTRQPNKKGIVVRHGIHVTPFGDCLFAFTEKGLCAMWFIEGKSAAAELGKLRSEWGGATFVADQKPAAETARRLFPPANRTASGSFHLHLRGTSFQIKVWQALLSVPFGKLATYAEIASRIGRPLAVRAVGTAIGKNPAAFLIPCHRVIRSRGTFGNYRWGAERKAAIIAWEAAGG